MAKAKKQDVKMETKPEAPATQSRFLALLRAPDRFVKLEDGWFHDRLLGRDWAPLEMIKHVEGWDKAKEYAQSTGGVLPEDFEIESLIDRSRRDPALPEVFKDIPTNDWYWTNTPLANSENWVWCADLLIGYMNGSLKGGTNYVWPVRSSQCGQSDLLPVR